MPTSIISRYISIILFISLVFKLCSCSFSPTTDSPDKASLQANQLFNEIFNEYLSLNPEWQTYLGYKKNNHLWNDRSEDAALKKLVMDKANLKRFDTLDTHQLDTQTRLSLTLYKQKIRNRISDYRWRDHNYPVNQMFGVHTNLPSLLINAHNIDNMQDAQAYIERLNGIPKVIEQVITKLDRQAKKGIVAPQFVFSYVINDCKNIITGYPFGGSEQNTLYSDFNTKIDPLKLTSNQHKQLQENLAKALIERVGPAYEKLIRTLKTLQKNATSDAGVWKLPDGKSYYQNALLRTTTTTLTAQHIHTTGLNEVARIHEDMRTIMKTVGFSGSLREFFIYMREDKQFYYSNTEAGRQAYLDKNIELIATMKAHLDSLFITKPKADLEVKRVEAYREKSAGKAFYQGPAPDGSRPGHYYANLYDMSQMPSYQMEALAYHEGIPGHHMQISIAQELKGLPKFRIYGGYTAYIEGWGLYAELLPKEIGFYTDPYSDFGRLAMELWRACRLVVDTGLHAFKWTREQAIDYLVNNTPNPKADSVKAIERYIVMPSQATAYKIGMLKILELRAKAKTELQERFDIREFHDVILINGAVPLDILETLVDQWIKQKKSH